MATKKSIELSQMTVDELQSELQATEVQYGKMQMEHAVRGLENPLTLREVRRDIARIKTEVKKRELDNVDTSTRSKIRARRRRKK